VRCAVAAAIALGVAATGGSASSLPASARLVYAALVSPARSDGVFDVDKAADLFSIRVDGTDSRRLTRTVQWETDPAWSPDGRRLVFSRGRTHCHGGTCAGALDGSLWVASAGGGAPRRLTHGYLDRWPTWAPDGQRIAFVRQDCCDDAPYDGVYVVGADGRGLRRVLATRAAGVDWSPDGAAIAVLGQPPEGGEMVLRLLDVTTGAASDVDANGLGSPLAVAWSPDGRTLAVVTGNGISLVARAGGTARRLVSAFYVTGVSWAPDGRRLAFNGSRERRRPRPELARLDPTDLWVIGRDGSGLRRLTRTPGPELAPDWRR